MAQEKRIPLPRDLIQFIFEAAYIQRWNDHIRPQGFTELDKQAHKMMILYVLARYEEQDHGASLDWQVLVEGGIFEFLHRVVLTDIKPPVFHELMRKSGHQLNQWVYKELVRRVPSLKGSAFMDKMQQYLDGDSHPLEKQLIRAAHYLATEWEFRIIYHMNQGIFGVEEIRERIADEIEDHYNLAGVQKIAMNGKTRKFVDLIGKLRFQKRWSQSPRVPETSVMGHVLIVAIMGYFCGEAMGACKARLVNDFLGGLWHDLPEVLTRDIISPIKRSIEGLEELIKDIEQRQMEEILLPLLPASWHEDILNFTVHEFENRIWENGKIRLLERDIPEQYNKDEYSPVDGRVLKGCDHLAAFLEAWLSIQCGITSSHLAGVVEALPKAYQGKSIGGIDFGKIYEQFR
ncbi:HD domain-containing protein [Acidaminococcus massiliensis]|jgi:putative hydrolase of HD superfamily|uniref:HD domain-containing protein n=1 Tax=Acidaminococcus massiliensis TaxID=1852375 RepID=UPI00094F148C|nr:HD domain-containing protein [Acidaminococcus massiliensis]